MKANIDRIKRDLDLHLRSLEGAISNMIQLMVGLNETIDKQNKEIVDLKRERDGRHGRKRGA